MKEEDRDKWASEYDPLQLVLQGLSTPLYMGRKKFKTGSVGWYLSQKAVLSDTTVQLSLCITVIGSKPQPPTVVVNKSEPAMEGPQTVQDLLGDRHSVTEVLTNGKEKRKRS